MTTVEFPIRVEEHQGPIPSEAVEFAARLTRWGASFEPRDSTLLLTAADGVMHDLLRGDYLADLWRHASALHHLAALTAAASDEA